MRWVVFLDSKVQCKVTIEEASWEEIDVCGGLVESESMGVNGMSCAISDSTGEEKPSQERLFCYFHSRGKANPV